MDSIQYEALQKMFEAKRLHPWIPEHHIFIQGELAKLEVTDPSAAVSHREFYLQKMETYKQEHPEEFPVQKVEDTKVEGTKKRGRKSSKK